MSGTSSDDKDAERSDPSVRRRRLSSVRYGDNAEPVRHAVPAGLVTDMEEIKLRDRLTENAWRRKAVSLMLIAFIALNVAVLAFLYVVWRGEADRPPETHIITEHVMLALIAGSVAQLGILAKSLGSALAKRDI